MDDIKKLTDYQLYELFFALKKQARIDAENSIENFGSEIRTRLFMASEHYHSIVRLISLEREMISRNLKP